MCTLCPIKCKWLYTHPHGVSVLIKDACKRTFFYMRDTAPYWTQSHSQSTIYRHTHTGPITHITRRHDTPTRRALCPRIYYQQICICCNILSRYGTLANGCSWTVVREYRLIEPYMRAVWTHIYSWWWTSTAPNIIDIKQQQKTAGGNISRYVKLCLIIGLFNFAKKKKNTTKHHSSISTGWEEFQDFVFKANSNSHKVYKEKASRSSSCVFMLKLYKEYQLI